MRRFRIWLGCRILPRDWQAAGPTASMAARTMTVAINADTTQFEASISRAKADVQELLDLTEKLP